MQVRPSQTWLHPYLTARWPLILAHQGDSSTAPGNTMPAFEAAVRKGCDALETDIHWTRDEVIVISHDETVDRMSNGTGRIADLSYAELMKLDFGYHFSVDGGTTFPFRNQGVKIPTLKELLEAYPSQLINVDIKPKRYRSLSTLFRTIYDAGAERRICLASFHESTLREIEVRAPDIARSASTCEVAETLVKSFLRLKQKRTSCIAFQIPARMYGIRVANRNFIRDVHQIGRKVHVWTINNPHEMKHLLDLGVNGIVTDDVAVAVRVRNEFFKLD